MKTITSSPSELRAFLDNKLSIQDYTDQMLEIILDEVQKGTGNAEERIIHRFEDENIPVGDNHFSQFDLGLITAGSCAYVLRSYN